LKARLKYSGNTADLALYRPGSGNIAYALIFFEIVRRPVQMFFLLTTVTMKFELSGSNHLAREKKEVATVTLQCSTVTVSLSSLSHVIRSKSLYTF
jgi:hypothetical protein